MSQQIDANTFRHRAFFRALFGICSAIWKYVTISCTCDTKPSLLGQSPIIQQFNHSHLFPPLYALFSCTGGPGPTLIIAFQEQHQQESQSSAIKTTPLVSCDDGPGATLIIVLASRLFLCGPRTDVTVTLKLNYKTYGGYLESCRAINTE